MQIDTHGLKPGKSNWKLFHLDGWSLLAELGPNTEGDGWGIHYRTVIDHDAIGEVSIWLGNPNENERTVALFDSTFENMTEEQAMKGLQMISDQTEGLANL